MFNNIRKRLEMLRPKSLTEKEKNFMWSNIDEGIESVKQSAVSSFSISTVSTFIRLQRIKRKFIIIPALIIALLGGTTMTAFASNSARPGDFLFPIDRISEDVMIIFATHKKRAELRVKFAEERLSEARELLEEYSASYNSLALLSNVGTTTDNGTNNTATNEDTGTSTPSTTNETATSTDNGTENTQESSAENLEVASNLAVAFEYLEEARAKLLADGNEAAAAVITQIINELTSLSENHLENFEEIELQIKNNGKSTKIKTKSNNGNSKTKFSFKQNGNNGNRSAKIEIEDGDSKTKLSLGNGFFNFKFKNNNSDKEESADDPDEDEDEDVHDDEDDDSHIQNGKKTKICHVPGGYPENAHEITVSTNALKAHLAHGDFKGDCDDKDEDEDGEDDEPVPDTTAPEITNIIDDTATTTSTISWRTDENANGIIWYSTTTPVNTLDGNKKIDETLSQDHAIELTSLTASTTYYFLVTSSDESGNTATSSEQSFETLSPPEPEDTTAPVIINLSVVSTTTSATITWNTDEASTSAIWYSTSTPVTATGIPTLENLDLVLIHSLDISSLIASSTYYYVISSSDESLNTSTSTESSFETP